MIDSSRLLSLFEKLVSLDSPSFGERPVCDFLKDYLLRLGIHAAEDASAAATGGNCGNLYAYIPGTLPLPPLLFCAHMDTVEPSSNKQAVLHPDGRITSAGTTVLGADDCSGLAAILEALTVIAKRQLPHRPLELLLTAAEEPYCAGVRHTDFRALKSREAYILDLSGPIGSFANQAPAILSFTAAFTGRSAHAGFSPESGIHAIQAAASAISALSLGRVDGSTVNVGTISGGTADNIIPSSCSLTGEIRSFSDEKAEEQLALVRHTLEDTAASCGASVDFCSTLHFSAYCLEPEHPVIRRFTRACRSQGLNPELCSTFGGSDNNILMQNGINGIVAACGMNSCHSCQEYTTAEDLARSAGLVLELMLSGGEDE